VTHDKTNETPAQNCDPYRFDPAPNPQPHAAPALAFGPWLREVLVQPERPIATVPVIVDTTAAAIDLLTPHLQPLPSERILAMFLGSRLQVVGAIWLGQGALSSVEVDRFTLIRAAAHVNACAMIVAHNHPDGDSTPSVHDNRLTDLLLVMGELINCQLMDHLIIPNRGEVYSYNRNRWAGTLASDASRAGRLMSMLIDQMHVASVKVVNLTEMLKNDNDNDNDNDGSSGSGNSGNSGKPKITH
jgi:hypothetical protein